MRGRIGTTRMKNLFNKLGNALVASADKLITYSMIFAGGAALIHFMPPDEVSPWIMGGIVAILGRLTQGVTVRV